MSVKMFKHKSYETGQFPEVNYCNLMPLLHELSDQNRTLRTDKKSNVKSAHKKIFCESCVSVAYM